jgi:CheY-like chemotaxis protein
VAED